MAITILESRDDNDYETGQPHSRGAYIRITDGAETYVHWVGRLPLTGRLQDHLNANEAKHFADAKANGIKPTTRETDKASAIDWLNANPQMKDFFLLPPAEVEAQIKAQTDALFVPGIPQNIRDKETKLNTASIMVIRIAAGGGLADIEQ